MENRKSLICRLFVLGTNAETLHHVYKGRSFMAVHTLAEVIYDKVHCLRDFLTEMLVLDNAYFNVTLEYEEYNVGKINDGKEYSLDEFIEEFADVLSELEDVRKDPTLGAASTLKIEECIPALNLILYKLGSLSGGPITEKKSKSTNPLDFLES